MEIVDVRGVPIKVGDKLWATEKSKYSKNLTNVTVEKISKSRVYISGDNRKFLMAYYGKLYNAIKLKC